MTYEVTATGIVTDVAAVETTKQVEVDSDKRLVELFLQRGMAANTVEAYMQDIGVWMKWVDKTYKYDKSTFSKITFRTAADFARWCKRTYSDATAARRVVTMRNLFKFGMQLGYLQFNPFAAVKTPSVRKRIADRILSENQVRQVIEAAGKERESCVDGVVTQYKRDRALVMFLYVTGCRQSEAINLRYSDLNTDDGVVYATIYGKGGKTRTVKIGYTLKAMMLNAATDETSEYVFHTQNGKRINRSQVCKIFQRISKEVGFKVTPHYLRHSHATHALRNGADIVTVRDSLGHGSLEVTSQYLHARPESASSDYINITGETDESNEG